jgi:hypothetical protein
VFVCTAGEREQHTGHEIKTRNTRGEGKKPTSSFNGQWDSTEKPAERRRRKGWVSKSFVGRGGGPQRCHLDFSGTSSIHSWKNKNTRNIKSFFFFLLLFC